MDEINKKILFDADINQPLLLTPVYKLGYLHKNNTTEFKMSKLMDSNYLCDKCKEQEKINCLECKKKYDKAFILNVDITENQRIKVVIPSFLLFNDKIEKYYTYILKWAKGYINAEKKPPEEEFITHIQGKYKYMMNQDFLIGKLSTASSGKNSFIRKEALGTKFPGWYLQLSINANLAFDEVTVPKAIYDKLRSPIGLVTRYPALNNKCCYSVTINWHDDDNNCIQVNPFIVDGLHADQDGDCVVINTIPSICDIPSYCEQGTYLEFENLTWANGSRVDISNNNRFEFGQHYNFIMYKYHDEMCKLLPGYKHIKCEKVYKPVIYMDLLNTIFRPYSKGIISKLIEFSKTCKISPTFYDLLDMDPDGTGMFNDIVNSKSKGTVQHIKKNIELLKKCNNYDESEIYNKAVQNFNKYIHSSREMGKQGRNVFIMLYSMLGIIMVDNHLFFEGNLIGTFMYKNSLMSIRNISYNSVKFVTDNLLKTREKI